MNKSLKKIIERSAVQLIVYIGKKFVKQIEKWWCKKNVVQTNHIIKRSDKLAPSETLNDAINKDTSTQEISLIHNMLYKGDTCLIVGAPNTGKSILAMQIGLDIAGGKKSKIAPNNDS